MPMVSWKSTSRDRTGEPPKTIYLQSHDLIALGSTPKQVRAITAMAVKGARIRIGVSHCGGVQAIDRLHVERIHGRPDEHYRQRIIDSE